MPKYRYSLIISLVLAIFCRAVYGLQGSTGPSGSNAQAVHQLGITGTGVKVGLITGSNAQANHLAFLDANGVTGVFNHDYTGDGFTYTFHDTPFAGIIKSRGSFDHPNDIGVAPDCIIHCGRVVDNDSSVSTGYIEDALTDLIGNYGCKVIVTGIQLSPDDEDANGQSQWTLMYDYFAEQDDVVFALAAGNSFSNDTVFGDAYNGITTGGLAETVSYNNNYFLVGSVSNPGPTLDGRRKPEVTAPSNLQVAPGYSNSSDDYWNTGYGDGATSWAVPHTAGIAALLLQYANQTADGNDGHSEVIKAVIVNSAFPNIRDKSGNPTNPADPNNVWHYQRGYGKVDALRAYQTLSAGRVSRNTTITSTTGWAYDTMAGSATHNYIITGLKNERLVLTVTWNRLVTVTRFPTTTYHDEGSPKFNIDVNVTNSASQVLFSESNSLDNLVKVDILLPADGNYTISLKNTTSKSRAYSLAFERLEPLTGDFDVDYIVDYLDLQQIAADWLTASTDTDIAPDQPDGIVNWLDFAKFANDWLTVEPKYYKYYYPQ